MEYSKLSEHIFKKGKFIAPWNQFMSELSREESWFYGRLPEYLWLGLILNHYERKDGLAKCYKIIIKLHQLAPSIIMPHLSKILDLDSDIQKELYSFISDIVLPEVMEPLTAIFTYSKYPCFSRAFIISGSLINDRIKKINSLLKETSNHQSYLSTDIRFVVLYFRLLSKKLHMQKSELDLILEYPNLSHEDQKMRIIRPKIRSIEMIQTGIEQYNENYLNLFWEEVSRMSDCELFYIDYNDNPHNIEEIKEYIEKIKSSLDYYSELMIASRPLDNKMLVLLSISTYSYKRILELIEHDLFLTISGRSVARVLIENYIMMKYLLLEEKNHTDIWTEYQYYGIGQFKLVVERILESGKDLKNSHVQVKYLNILINEYKNKEFLDMDTSYFDKKNVREKAKIVGEQELFGFFYDYDSAYEHGLWGAIRESSLVKCNSPSHQYHCVPDLENNQKLISVWADCFDVMNKTITILDDVYGCPEHLKLESN